MKIQIICKGTRKSGLGHLFRSKTFARHALSRHEVEIVALSEPGLEKIFDGLDCPVRHVTSSLQALPLVAAYRPDALLYDLTEIEPVVMRKANAKALLTVSLSPLFAQMDMVDVLFTRLSRQPPVRGVTVFAGPEYAIFNDSCRVIDDVHYRRSLEVPTLPVALCMGGADAPNKTLRMLRRLMDFPSPCLFWVMLGEGYSHSYQDLVDCTRESRHEIILAKTSDSLWRILGNCAVALLAGGLTTVEAIYAGLPSINIFESREHADMLTELFEQGICINGGILSDDSLSTMLATLDHYYHNRSELLAVRERGRRLLDKSGAELVLKLIEEFVASRQAASSWRVVDGDRPLAPTVPVRAAAVGEP